MKFLKFFEYVYLGVAILSLIEVFNEWNSPDKTRLYIFILFAAVSLLCFSSDVAIVSDLRTEEKINSF